jgi:hypothetical protein
MTNHEIAEFGRFAADYRVVFNELPSETFYGARK